MPLIGLNNALAGVTGEYPQEETELKRRRRDEARERRGLSAVASSSGSRWGDVEARRLLPSPRKVNDTVDFPRNLDSSGLK